MNEHLLGAVLDIGTNSVRLFVAEVIDQDLKPLLREAIVTRLGQGVDATRKLSESGIRRTLAALVRLIQMIPSQIPVSILATSAVRDAENRDDFARSVQERTGISLRILSGDEEAELSFAGAVFSLREYSLPQPITVVDIGGGSTEIYTGLANGQLLGGGSAQVGAVRMLERFITSHPLLHSERLAMEAEIECLLKPLAVANAKLKPRTLVAVGGTATSLAAMMQGLPKYNHEQVTGFAFSLAELTHLYTKLGKLSLAERGQIPSLQKGREDLIVCGAAILHQAAQLLGFSRLYSSAGDLLLGELVKSLLTKVYK